ncbi:uncharacterized protein prr33 isoform 1-T2 [Pholidichthys leucotaenia]
MAVAYRTVTHPVLLSQQFPPPLLPKPGKDNVRLQKLLKRTAKKKASAQAPQSAAPFRSSLSPVNEASPDLEHSDHSTPPRTPETSASLYGVQQPPRFTVKLPYQHVASPYPQRASYGRAARMSPQTVASPSYAYSQHTTTVSSYSASAYGWGLSAAQLVVPNISLPAYSEPQAPGAELKKPAFSTFSETPAGLRPAATASQLKPTSPSPTPYSTPVGQAVIRPLTVLTTLKSKSPHPTFKATEPSRSPKTMFDVPQIRMYTASTSFYETSKTPPVYDMAGLMAIGSMVPQAVPQPKIPFEAKYEPTTPSLGTDAERNTATLEVKSESSVITALTSETKRATPTFEVKTPTSEIKRATPTSEVKRATPTSEGRVKTPAYDIQGSRISAGRPRTPAYHVTRSPTPVFEISRPNPLLFAVSPITVEPDRSRTSQEVSASASQCVKTMEASETLPNGDVLQDMVSATKPTPSTEQKTSEPELTRGVIPITPVGSQRAKTPPVLQAVTGYQRPKTPTYEANRLMSSSPGYKRPKTPTYGTSPSSASPVAFQRPKTPTQVPQKPKSTYRGLTPAEYTAYGGIKTHTPAFGIGSSVAQEQVSEEPKTPGRELPVKGPSTSEVSKVKETSGDVDKPQQTDEKVPATPSVPIIIVSQASNSLGTMTQDMSTASDQARTKQEMLEIHETPKVIPQTEKKKKKETSIQENKPKTPEAKPPPPKGDDQEPLKAVKKLLGKGKAQMTTPKAGVSEQKEPVKPETVVKPEGSKPSSGAEVQTEDNSKDQKEAMVPTVQAAAERKEGDDAPTAAKPLLKAFQKPKGVKSKVSGWSRLKKHMVVEQEEPKFPDSSSQKETGEDRGDVKKVDDEKKPGTPDEAQTKDTPDEAQTKDTPKATKMWDAVLFQMFSSKENIMHQIELNKSEDEKMVGKKEEPKEIPSFAYRLPVLLFSPRFDAKKLKEAAARPATKISTAFEMGLIGRKGKEEEPKDFNRTAKGFSAT